MGAADGEDLAEKGGAAAGESRTAADQDMTPLPAMTLKDGAGRKILLWNEYYPPCLSGKMRTPGAIIEG